MINYYNYYLVALNLEENGIQPRIINLNNDILKENDEKELTNLAYIDNLTSKYDETVFRKYLYEKEIIKNTFTPIFIVRLSTTYKKDSDGNSKKKTNIKYYCPIFKSKDASLINNVALTTIRQRSLAFSDASYLLKYFEDLFYKSEEYRSIVEYIINEHDIKHLLNYEYYVKDKKSNPIKYSLLREVVSTLYEFEKSQSFEKFMGDVYGREESALSIVKILPEVIKVKKSDLNPVRRLSDEEIENIKNQEWDNKEAKEQFRGDTINERVLYTLTLEDRLRAGLIDGIEYSNTRENYETKFRK